MSKFMFVYKGEATDMSAMTEDESQAVMAKWGAWMEKVGPAMADVGAPFGPGSSVVDDGSPGTAISLSGYTIVNADDMAGAEALTDGHPYLSDNDGKFAIDIYELLPVPFQE